MISPFERIPTVPRYENIVNRVTLRYRKLVESLRRKNVKLKDKEIKKLNLVYEILISSIRNIVEKLPYIDKVHPFYKDLLDVLIGYDNYKKAVVRLARAIKLIDKIYREYLNLIKVAEDPWEIRSLRKQGVGRMMSVLKRNRKYIDFLAENIVKLKRIPSIDPEKPTIIVAGMPQVGKSTLVKRISTAKTEIASYPFTTKNLILGHIRVGHELIQAIDTPGLLDRPLSERNPIELQAIMALKHVKGIIIYLFDVSINSYYTVDEQINVLKDIMGSFDKEIIVAINKIDDADKNKINKVINELNKIGFDTIFKISALKGIGVDELLKHALSKLLERSNANVKDSIENSRSRR